VVELVMSCCRSGESDGQPSLGEAAVYEVAAVLDVAQAAPEGERIESWHVPPPAELRRRAVRMVAEVRADYETEWAAMMGCREQARDRNGRDGAPVGPPGPDRLRAPARDDDGGIRPGQRWRRRERVRTGHGERVLLGGSRDVSFRDVTDRR
jgi:hypothetical protein